MNIFEEKTDSELLVSVIHSFLSVFWVVCQPLSLIELEKGHFARYFKNFFDFFQKHLAKHALPDSKDRRTRKMRKATASP